MVPTAERAAWFLATDATTTVAPGASPSAGPAASPDLSPGPSLEPSSDPDVLEWRTLPVYECDLQVAFVTEGESTGTRRTGSAEVRVPASLRGGLALYHSPVMPERDPLTGWTLGPDGWTCVRSLGADFDTMASGLTIRSQAAARIAAARCGGFGCAPAVGSDSGRFIAYGSMLSGTGTSPAATRYGVPGTTACSYLRPFRVEEGSGCHGIPIRTGHHHVPGHTSDGSTWVDFTTTRGEDTVAGAVGVDCSGNGCLPHLIECKLRPEDRALCDATLQVMLDPGSRAIAPGVCLAGMPGHGGAHPGGRLRRSARQLPAFAGGPQPAGRPRPRHRRCAGRLDLCRGQLSCRLPWRGGSPLVPGAQRGRQTRQRLDRTTPRPAGQPLTWCRHGLDRPRTEAGPVRASGSRSAASPTDPVQRR